MDKLKPCPFCGGVAEVIQKSFGTESLNSAKLSFRIECAKCGATAPGARGYISVKLSPSGELYPLHDDRENAIMAWNRRASDATI